METDVALMEGALVQRPSARLQRNRINTLKKIFKNNSEIIMRWSIIGSLDTLVCYVPLSSVSCRRSFVAASASSLCWAKIAAITSLSRVGNIPFRN